MRVRYSIMEAPALLDRKTIPFAILHFEFEVSEVSMFAMPPVFRLPFLETRN
jgi:hypothetical protein